MDFTNLFYLVFGFIVGGMIWGGLAVFFDRLRFTRKLQRELPNHPEYKLYFDVMNDTIPEKQTHNENKQKKENNINKKKQ